jgi:hypothetical protein
MVLAAFIPFMFMFAQKLRLEVMDVCDVLQEGPELNGKLVRVRGAWWIGDTGEELEATTPCKPPTIRDGWSFWDTIEVVPHRYFGTGEAKVLRLLAKGKVKVLVTLTGRLETSSHFQTYKDAYGAEYPRAFGHSAARLRFSRADDFETVPYDSGELERELERGGKPWPKRVPQ